MPCDWMSWMRPARRMSPKRFMEGFHSPTMSHQPPSSLSYHPASMQNTSAPTLAAPSTSGSSFSMRGSPHNVFM